MASWTTSTAPYDTARQPGELQAMRLGITKVWKGELLVKKTDGYVYSAYNAGAVGDQFVGVAAETVDNRYIISGDSGSGAASVGDRFVRSWQEGIFTFKLAAAATIETELGLTAYVADGSVNADDAYTVTITAPAAQPIIAGVVVELLGSQVASTLCRVRIAPWSAVGA